MRLFWHEKILAVQILLKALCLFLQIWLDRLKYVWKLGCEILGEAGFRTLKKTCG